MDRSKISMSPGFLKSLEEHGITPDQFLDVKEQLERDLVGEDTLGVRIKGGHKALCTVLATCDIPWEISICNHIPEPATRVLGSAIA